jgi:hypothetical protein
MYSQTGACTSGKPFNIGLFLRQTITRIILSRLKVYARYGALRVAVVFFDTREFTMRLRLFSTPWFCALWGFLGIYAGLIYIALTVPGGRYSDIIASSLFAFALLVGWIPASIGAACVWLFAWLARRFLPPPWRAPVLLPLLAALAAWPLAYQYYQTHYSAAAQSRTAYEEAGRLAPGGLAEYMDGGAWSTRREAFLANYGDRFSGRTPLDSRDIPVVERLLAEKFAEHKDLPQAAGRFYWPRGVYTLFGDLIVARLGTEAPAELFARWPPGLLVDALFSPESLQKLDTLTLSESDAAILYEQAAAAASALDPYGAYGLVWLDLRYWQTGSLPKVFGHCEALQQNRDFCLRFAVERVAAQLHPQIAAAADLHPDDAAALAQTLRAYFDAPRKFMPPEMPSALFRWVVLDALNKRPLEAVFDEWSEYKTEVLKTALSAPVLSRLQTQADWTTHGRAVLQQALAELPETPRPEPQRFEDFYGVWMPWMNAQLDVLQPGRLAELFGLCRRLPAAPSEQRSSCFRYIFDNLKGREEYAGMHVAGDAEHRQDFAALTQAVEELPQLTRHKGMQLDARLALYKLRKALLRPGETPELLAAAQHLDAAGGYGVTYRLQTLQWLMAEAHAEPPRYRPDAADRAGIAAAAEEIGSRFKAQWERVGSDREAAMALGNAPEKAYLDSQAILAWIRGD